MSAIQKSGTNFGTTSICRVPFAQRGGQIMPSVTTGCVSCVSGDGIDGGPVWWTDPYTAWAAKKKADKSQKRKAASSLDADTEARLKALRGEGGGGEGSSGAAEFAAATTAGAGSSSGGCGGGGRGGGSSSSSGGGGGGMALDPAVEARLAALRGGGAAAAPARDDSFANKGYDSD
jgi:hypothetical protein